MEDESTLPILWEDNQCLVVGKPAGLFAQAPPDIPSVESSLRKQLCRPGQDSTPYVGLPHRLDRATSGALLIARNQRALKRFGQQFQSRKVGKYYLAVSSPSGTLPKSEDNWEDYIRKVDGQPRAEIVVEGHGGRLAHLTAVPAFCSAENILWLVRLHTGRMHQIRLQAASRGWPILGDLTYGRCGWGDLPRDPRQAAIALHALRIEFRHPKSGKVVAVTAPLPENWRRLDTALLQCAYAIEMKSKSQAESQWDEALALEFLFAR